MGKVFRTLCFTAFVIGILAIPAFAYAGEIEAAGEQKVVGQNLEMPDAEELLSDYIEVRAMQETGQAEGIAKNSRGSRLTGNDAVVYKAMREAIGTIAAGGTSNAEAVIPVSEMLGELREYTAADLGVESLVEGDNISNQAADAMYALCAFDADKVLAALRADLPYDFYWYDKTRGVSITQPDLGGIITQNKQVLYFDGDNPSWRIQFNVSQDYSLSCAAGTSMVDVEKTGAATKVAENAAAVVTDNQNKSDLEKLTAYKEKICDSTDYNDAAVENPPEYGDPWQMIYVFDGDPATTVVCEGYAKAFQFLCDLTDFSSGTIASNLVTGDLVVNADWEPHMWNIVHMNDGKNYLVDVTNCDGDGAGAPDLLFLKGYTSSSGNNYSFTCGQDTVSYTYDKETLSQFDAAELVLSASDYEESTVSDCTHQGNVEEHAKVDAKCGVAGTEAYWECKSCNTLFSDKDCTKKISKPVAIPALQHDYHAVEGSAVKATLTADGKYADQKCSRCGDLIAGKVIPKNNMTAVPAKKTLTVKVKKKTTFKRDAAFTVKNAKGTVTFRKMSGNSKITVSSTGKVIVKRGLKAKKIYPVKVKVTTKATDLYDTATITVTLRIKGKK